eukprot:753032-Rhodomonas_salina.1
MGHSWYPVSVTDDRIADANHDIEDATWELEARRRCRCHQLAKLKFYRCHSLWMYSGFLRQSRWSITHVLLPRLPTRLMHLTAASLPSEMR